MFSPPSLLVRGLPRSRSSLFTRVLTASIQGLKALPETLAKNPELDIAGELLNRTTVLSKSALPYRQGTLDDPERFAEMDEAIWPYIEGGYVIKDVNQYGFWSWWLSKEENRNRVRTIYLWRHPTDIIYRMIVHGWWYPIRAACGYHANRVAGELANSDEKGPCPDPCNRCALPHVKGRRLEMMTRALLLIEHQHYTSIPHNVTVNTDGLLTEPGLPFHVAQQLGYHTIPYDWWDDEFHGHKQRTSGYRLEPLWLELNDLRKRIRAELQQEGRLPVENDFGDAS